MEVTGEVVDVLVDVVGGAVVELDDDGGVDVDVVDGTVVVDGMVVVALTMAVAKLAIWPAIHVARVR